MPQLSLSAGQISEPVEVGPGTRVTATGSGYVEWTTSTLADVRNGIATWQVWPKGSTVGYADTLRRVVMRARAVGALVVVWEEGKRDEGPEGVYWQEDVGGAVDVRAFGAKGDGVTDDTAAFSLAARTAPAASNIVGAEATLPRAAMCQVIVPAGAYVLTSEVNTGGREVAWVLDPAAVVAGYAFLNGKVLRLGQRQNDAHHGTTDYACGYSIRSNVDLEDGSEVLGITDPSQLATYADRDTVSLFVDNVAPPALADVGTATYTATTVTIAAPSAATVRRYRRGMIVDTKHSPKWSGVVTEWNAAGSVLTVTAWYQVGGGAGTPADGTGCAVNAFTKAWGQNTNITLTASSYASKGAGFELGVLNNKGALDYGAQTNYVVGMDVVSLGTNECAIGFLARHAGAGKIFRGFQSTDASQVNFYASGTAPNGFWSEQTAGVPFKHTKASVVWSQIDNNGVATVQSVISTGVVRPSSDNVATLGAAAQRWSVVYAATGAINTSDGRLKADVREVSAAEARVAVKLKALLRAYRFKDSMAEKGDAARIHFGVIAQDVVEAFASEGLDAHRYALLCFDKWDASPEQRDENGNLFAPAVEAGERYGVRYEELLAFVLSAT